MQTNLLFLHALSPLHAGTGQGVGAIDLPIAREKATNLPIVPGSSIKGVLRANCTDDILKTKVFGPETNNASDHAGSAQFSDLRLLFLPVRSLSGTFAWVTSPLVLQRFARDCGMAGETVFAPPVFQEDETEKCFFASESSLKMAVGGKTNQVVLEDLPLQGEPSPELDAFLVYVASKVFPQQPEWHDTFKKRVCVVHDNVLALLLETATEVTARIKLTDAKTVQDGALWYEESLPAESILAGLMTVQEVKDKNGKVVISREAVVETVKGIASPLQVGGNSTVGRGLCNLHLV